MKRSWRSGVEQGGQTEAASPMSAQVQSAGEGRVGRLAGTDPL